MYRYSASVYFMALLGVLLALPASLVYAQEKEGFLLLSGNDTISVERYSEWDNSFEGRALIKNQIPISYKGQTDGEHRLERMELKLLKGGAPEGTPPQQSAILNFRGDTLFVSSEKNGSISRDTISTSSGAMAYHPNIPMLGLLQKIVMRGRQLKEKNVDVPVFLMSTQGKTLDAQLDFSTPDSVRVTLGTIQVDLKINSDGRILGGKTQAGQTIERMESVPDVALAGNAPDYSAPADAPYRAEEVKIETEAGHTLAGTLTLPKDMANPVPAVITITGSSPQDRDNNTPFGGPYRIFYQLADTLGRQGIAVLRMDDRGVGASTGNLESATTKERAEDTREQLEFIKDRSEIDKDKIFLVGLSEGGVIAPLIAASNDNIGGIVLLAGPASTGKEIFKYQLEEGVKQRDTISTEKREEIVQKQMEEILKEANNDEWLQFFLNYNPLETAKKVNNIPVLILHGSTDKNVPPGDAEKLAAAFREGGNSSVTLRMFEGVNHIFIKDANGHPSNYQNLESFKIAPEVMATIVNWIRETAGMKGK